MTPHWIEAGVDAYFAQHGQLARKQHAMQLVTPWERVPEEQYFFRTEARLWVQAVHWVRHALERRSGIVPTIDFLTRKALEKVSATVCQ